jgi:hypothetical protein
MYGDTNDPDVSQMNEHLGRACVLSAKRNHLDLSLVVMRGFGHELPPKYDDVLGMWVRGEELPK